MKISNWRRKLAAALLAGNAICSSSLRAADLNANLLLNPGFESVNLNALSLYYNAPLILNWQGPVSPFAYSHDLSGGGVPDFANGTLSTGGHWYFTPGNNAAPGIPSPDSFANAIYQELDLSTGATATAITGGSATYSLSGFFSTYSTQADRAFVRVEFLNGSQSIIGTGEISTPLATVLATWTQFTATGAVPAGTVKAKVSSWGEVFVGSPGAPDGYQDNLDFRVLGPAAPEPGSASLIVAAFASLYAVARRRMDD